MPGPTPTPPFPPLHRRRAGSPRCSACSPQFVEMAPSRLSDSQPQPTLLPVSVVACVSGHGFGHFTRTAPLLERLAEEAPVHLRTGGPTLTLARRAGWAASVAEWDLGPGCVQRGPLEVDVPATVAAVSRHVTSWPGLLGEYGREARRLDARLIVADAPPLGFALGERLGVPALAVANFSWSWIYEPFLEPHPELTSSLAILRGAEALATHLIALPGGGGLDAFGRAGVPRLEAVLRRPPTCDVEEARRRLAGLAPPGDRPRVLLSFGGYGDALDLSAAAERNPELAFLAFAPPPGPLPANLAVLPHDHGLPHQDLVLGAAAVLSKPGYGTVAECLTRPTPMVYVEPTGTFREHPRLVREIEERLPSAALTPARLRAGDWSEAVEAALAAPARAAAPTPQRELERAVSFARAARDG